MINKRRILFIGSFLSANKGTKDVAEKVSELLSGSKYKFKLSSKYHNKVIRLIDIIQAIIFSTSKVVFVDVFSGPAFTIAKIAVFFSKIRCKKVILILRGGGLVEFADKNPKLVLNVFKKADSIQTPSLFLKGYFESKDLKINYLPNPVNLSSFIFKEHKVLHKKLLWVRAFGKVYNPDIPVKLLSAVIKKYPSTTLTLVGPDIGLLSQTQQLAVELGVMDKINFVGPIKNSNLPDFYHSHDVYLNTPSFESFGVAVLEAAACGIPIISFNVGEIPYLWEDNKNILLTSIGSIDEMVEKVTILFENKDLFQSISFQGRENIAKYSWKVIMPQWESVMDLYS